VWCETCWSALQLWEFGGRGYHPRVGVWETFFGRYDLLTNFCE